MADVMAAAPELANEQEEPRDMPNSHHRFAAAGAVLLALLAGTSGGAPAHAHEFKSKTVTIAHPWVRATPPGAKVGVAYFEIQASKAGGDRLIGASADSVAGRVEIHTHEHGADGVIKMRQIADVAVPAGTSVVLGPAGHHLMLMDLKKPLVEGDLVAIKLQFEKAGNIDLEAGVEPVGAKGPHGMDHQPGHDASTAPMDHGAHKH